MLVINKIDLAPHVGADLSIMKRDAEKIRGGRPYVFVNCQTGQGIEDVVRRRTKDAANFVYRTQSYA
ncbi:Urease accessory protein UreG [Candidatus Nitrosotalea sp. FS]|nr:Urease accessory protein UreG [Candidatus Nitrosotalea sp. FS]